jgi:AraC-like DNA-binding protein
MINALSFPVSNKLGSFIHSYGIIEEPEGFSQAFVSPPLGFSRFIICTEGETDAFINGERFVHHKAVASGQVTSAITGSVSGKVKSIMVFFQPAGMYRLFGFDMSKLTDTSMDLHKFLGIEKAQVLLQKLKHAECNEAIVYILNEFFISRLSETDNTADIKNLLDFIHVHSGKVSVKEIEKHCYMQRKSIERSFHTKVGLSPKIYAEIFRFKCLMGYLKQHPGITWLQLSEQNGYFDQSHMVRYFKAYLKVSPTNLVKLDVDFINYLLKN